MVKLSVCLIVKNEENVLERCLNCVKKFADEIIIVDTGSTDNTIEIAKKFTNKIFNYIWQDDFSKARNYAFKMASGEYLMWIDADDIVKNENIKRINRLKQNLTAETYMFKYQISFDENDNCTFEYYRERIVKNCAKAKFKGFVHECIVPFGKIVYENIAIQHKKVDSFKDKKRNLKLYQKHLKNNKQLTERETFYYAKELFYNGYYQKTIKILKKYLKMPNKFLPNIIDAYITISDCFLMLNDLQASKKYLIDSMNVLPPNAKICCKLGNIYIKENYLKNAIFWYKTALNSQKNEESGEFFENDYYNFTPYLQLSFCYYYLNDYENFKAYHLKAKAIKPTNKIILYNDKFITK